MEQTKITMRLYDGYRIERREKLYDPARAYDILSSRRKRRYTAAQWEGEKIKLTKDVFICPHCGKETPAYQCFLNGETGDGMFENRVELSAWTGMQLAFEEERDTLFLQDSITAGKKIICPRCKKSSQAAETSKTVFVENGKDCVFVGREITRPGELMDIPWIAKLSLSGSFPLTERLVFHFKTGQTIIELLNAEGEICQKASVEDWQDSSLGGILCQLLIENKLVRRFVLRAFQNHWSAKIPFSSNEISLRTCREMVLFQNYPRSFYDAIPYIGTTMQIEGSFLTLILDLRTAENAVKMLSEYGLPAMKSVRRCFCQNAGLLFYIKECRLLYQVVNDENLFCSILGSERTFCFLSELHLYPGVKTFLEDFAKVTSQLELCRCIREYPEYMIRLGINYVVMSGEGRALEQKNWKQLRKKARQGDFRDGRLCFSLPMRTLPTQIKSQKMNGFFFKLLRTTVECKIAGENLRNCLQRWESNDNPIVGIYQGHKLVAAAEVEGDRVVQALRYQNEEIDVFSDLYEALKKWCEGNKLSLELWNDDLPF